MEDSSSCSNILHYKTTSCDGLCYTLVGTVLGSSEHGDVFFHRIVPYVDEYSAYKNAYNM